MIDLNVYNTCVFVFCKRQKLWAQSHYILNSPRIRLTIKHINLWITHSRTQRSNNEGAETIFYAAPYNVWSSFHNLGHIWLYFVHV